jgi:hypothetical protein
VKTMSLDSVESLNRPLPMRQGLPGHSVKPRPLMPIAAVMWRLDRHENAVLAMIEEGELLFAFDVRAPKALKPSPRVLAQSVEDYLAGNRPRDEDEQTEWRRIVSLIFPDKPVLVKYELARLLNCGRQHATDLVYARQFRLVPGSRIRPGPGGSAQIETASVEKWLLKRRML